MRISGVLVDLRVIPRMLWQLHTVPQGQLLAISLVSNEHIESLIGWLDHMRHGTTYLQFVIIP